MPSDFFPNAPGVFTGDQIRASGFLHDGSIDSVAGFLSAQVLSTNTT